MLPKPYKIEYGRAIYYKAAKQGESYHVSRPLTLKQARSRLKLLNKKYDYTTVFERKNGTWKPIG